VWLEAVVYVMVLITVVSGLDYFFGIRRRVAAAEDLSTPSAG
jgi:hypothetical protein